MSWLGRRRRRHNCKHTLDSHLGQRDALRVSRQRSRLEDLVDLVGKQSVSRAGTTRGGLRGQMGAHTCT